MPEGVAIVVPCYNERSRLRLQPFFDQTAGCRFVFVDDGSTDGTAAFLEDATRGRSGISVLHGGTNRGKAEAVRLGMLHCLDAWPDCQWLGFWDADLSTPLSEVERFLRYRAAFLPEADAIFGCRVKRMGAHVRRRPLRHGLGRVFSSVVSLYLGFDKVYDSQCGAKLFRRHCVRSAFAAPFVSRWIFDVEILARLPDRTILECPLFEWEDVRDSRLTLASDALPILRDLRRIRQVYRLRTSRRS